MINDLKVNPGVYLEELRKTTGNLGQNSWCYSGDFN
jgi:hypothetical protein